ncbi:MAG: hypothetical protein ACRDDX_12825 [Cellulosilyticaceae bacterium]
MPYASKRHYRVAQRDKEMLDENVLEQADMLQKLTLFAIIAYIMTTIISFSLGYVIGKNE